jgi:TonB family protein
VPDGKSELTVKLATPTSEDNGASVSPVSRSSRRGAYQDAVLEVFVRPVYPDAAKRMRIEGDVELKLNIASNGSVQGVRVLSGNSALAKAAKEAAQQWRYRPALLNGSPTAAETRAVLTFRVEDSKN